MPRVGCAVGGGSASTLAGSRGGGGGECSSHGPLDVLGKTVSWAIHSIWCAGNWALPFTEGAPDPPARRPVWLLCAKEISLSSVGLFDCFPQVLLLSGFDGVYMFTSEYNRIGFICVLG